MFARRKPDFRRAFLSERGESAAADAGNAASVVLSAAVGLPRYGAAVGAVCTRVPCLRQAAVSSAEAALRPQSPPLRLPSRLNIARSASAARRGANFETLGTWRNLPQSLLLRFEPVRRDVPATSARIARNNRKEDRPSLKIGCRGVGLRNLRTCFL